VYGSGAYQEQVAAVRRALYDGDPEPVDHGT
jgi:hypothetical protein